MKTRIAIMVEWFTREFNIPWQEDSTNRKIFTKLNALLAEEQAYKPVPAGLMKELKWLEENGENADMEPNYWRGVLRNMLLRYSASPVQGESEGKL